MTVNYESKFTVVCDVCGYERWLHNMSRKYAQDKFITAGWQIYGNRAVCPKCVSKGRSGQ